jgi:hypothetical protein
MYLYTIVGLVDKSKLALEYELNQERDKVIV